jgi:hypothetical protein
MRDLWDAVARFLTSSPTLNLRPSVKFPLEYTSIVITPSKYIHEKPSFTAVSLQIIYLSFAGARVVSFSV